MQQLQNASDPVTCAADILDAVLEVMVSVRETCARRHGGGPTLIRFRAMGVLRKRPGATLSVLSDQLALTLSATSRLIDSLVEQGLVVRKVPAGNRRTVSLALTAAGNKSLDAAIRETRKDLAARLEKLTPKERTAICRSMKSLRAVMEGC